MFAIVAQGNPEIERKNVYEFIKRGRGRITLVELRHRYIERFGVPPTITESDDYSCDEEALIRLDYHDSMVSIPKAS